jgi:hypothetical protein
MNKSYSDKMHVSGKILAVIIGITLAILLPLQCAAQTMNENTDFSMESRGKILSEDIQSKGDTDNILYGDYAGRQNISQEAYYRENEDVIKSYAVHTHTDDCYDGHRHGGDCYSVSNITKSGKIAELTIRDPYINYNNVQVGNYNYKYRITFQCASVGHIVATLYQYISSFDSRYDKIESVWYGDLGQVYSNTVRRHSIRSASAPGYVYNSSDRNYVSIDPDPNYAISNIL